MERLLAEDPEHATDEDYVKLITAAEAAYDFEPQNVKYGYWLNHYRWDSLSRVINPDTGEVLLHPEVLPFVERIANELTEVRRICPTYGLPYSLEGQLRLFVLKDESGAELIRKGARLAAYDPSTCLVAGELAARGGNHEEADKFLTRAVELHSGNFKEAALICLRVLNRPDLARKLSGDNYGRLQQLAEICATDPNHAALAEEFRAAAVEGLRRRTMQSDVSPHELAAFARIELKNRRLESAVKHFQRALIQDYRQVGWRLELANAFIELEEYEKALDEVEICLRLRTQYPPAMKLRADLVDRLNDIRE
jgi:tetratricopeptide (TPR) repeat protein